MGESSASSGDADWSRAKGVFKFTMELAQTHVMELLEVKRGFFVHGKMSRYVTFSESRFS